MAYTDQDFKTKALLKLAVSTGAKVRVFQPNQMCASATPPVNGKAYVEGPHYPKPHTWYAVVELRDGVVVSVK